MRYGDTKGLQLYSRNLSDRIKINLACYLEGSSKSSVY